MDKSSKSTGTLTLFGVARSGIIVGIIIVVGAIVGLALIAPSALRGGNSHGPSEPLVSTVVIQEGAGLADSDKGFEPATITVYIGSITQ